MRPLAPLGEALAAVQVAYLPPVKNCSLSISWSRKLKTQSFQGLNLALVKPCSGRTLGEVSLMEPE